MPEEFKLGDLVWAKMKGFCPWPGRVVKPGSKLKRPPKKTGFQSIYFFGTHNFAWIDDANIKPYEELKSKLVNSNKSASFVDAVKDIEDFIKQLEENPNYDPLEHLNVNAEFDKLKDEEKEKDKTPKKPRKESLKRASTTPVTPATPKRKKPETPKPEGNGTTTPSYTNVTNHVKNYEAILNRPILDVPEAPSVDLSKISDNFKSKNINASTAAFGFLGLGIMGSGMVKNLIISGHKVNIWSRSMEKADDIKEQADNTHPGQVNIYGTPCDIVANSDIIFCCVSDAAAVKDIVLGNCGVLYELDTLAGKGYVEMSNIDSETSLDISELITSKGGKYLEAQLQGSKPEADDGNLIVLCAGDNALYESCSTCFAAIGKAVFYLGQVGFATKMNVVLQAIKGVALLGVTEGLALADRAGIAAMDVLEVFSLTNFCSPYLSAKADMIKSADFQNVEQPLQHMQKDMKLALQLADAVQQPMMMASAAKEIYKHARRLGYETYDTASVYMRSRY